MQQSRKRLVIVAALVIVTFIAVYWSSYEVRISVKWLVLSHRYKSAVLSEGATNGKLRHVGVGRVGWHACR